MTKNELQTEIDKLGDATYKQVIVFLKKTNCYNCKRNASIYWRSDLSIKWFDKLIQDDFFEDYLFGYFSSDKNVNLTFLKKLISLSQTNRIKEIKKIIKLSESFQHEEHWNSFGVFINNSEFKTFYKELKYIRDIRSHWNIELSNFSSLIDEISNEDFLIQITSYFEKFKRYGNSQNTIISYRAHLFDIINEVLNLKKQNINSKIENHYTVSEFNNVLNNELPPVRPADTFTSKEYIPNESISDTKAKCRKLIDFLFQKSKCEYQIQKYLTGFAEFEWIKDLESEISVNKNYNLYRQSLEKGHDDENYLSNCVVERKEFIDEINTKDSLWEKHFLLNQKTAVEYFKFLNIPINIKRDRKSTITIDIEKVFILLQQFSTLMIPQGRIIIPIPETNEIITYKKEIPSEFKKLFDPNYIVCYKQDELVEKCFKYFKWEKEEIEIIVEYLTTDLDSDRKFTIDINKRPLIKIGNKIIWLSSFYKDRRWEIFLHKKIVSDRVPQNLNNQPAQTERYIAEIFREAKFNSIPSHRYSNNGIKGEIDVLAYKNKTLFILELKSTYIEEDIMNTSKYETLKFNSLASSQLDKAKKYVNDKFSELKQIEALGIDCKLEELKIETFIISNIYQSDYLIFKNNYKISLFELLIILKNDLHKMLTTKWAKELGFDFEMFTSVIRNMMNGNRDNLKSYNQDDCKLWEDNSNCQPQDIISAVKENKVWQHLQHDSGNVEIHPYRGV